MRTIYIIVTFFLLSGCNLLFNSNAEDRVIASVGSEKLTFSELQMAIPSQMKEVDSISFAQNYIEKWVKDQLMLEKAELNIDKNMQNEIDVLINNYRTSLMVFKYQQMFIQQKLDTLVTKEQVNEYYANHAGNFRLDNPVVKAIYVKLPKSIHDRYRVRTWIRSSREDDMITLEDYCYQNARNFYMGEDWQYFYDILNNIPKEINDQEQFLRTKNYIETSDSLYAYYINILDYKLANDTTPVMFVDTQIKDILINHRKVNLINELENNVYNDAVNHKKFTIHTN